MSAKLVTPNLGPLDDEPSEVPAPVPPARPELRVPPRRSEPRVDSLVTPGFVSDALPVVEPVEPTEVLTIEVPRRLKRALLAEVAERKDDPQRRMVASMKSVILEALTAYGFSQFINRSDIEVQAGIFMKRQAAQLRKRG
jgi:hypothetical protein